MISQNCSFLRSVLPRCLLALVALSLLVAPVQAQDPTPTAPASPAPDLVRPIPTWPPRPPQPDEQTVAEAARQMEAQSLEVQSALQIAYCALGEPYASTEAFKRMVYMSYRDLSWELYRTDGLCNEARPVRITNNVYFDGYPRLNNQTGQVVFVSDRRGSDDIFSMSPDGSAEKQLTTDPATDTYPTWSPDGSQIAFVSDRTGDAELYVMKVDGSQVRRLTTFPGQDMEPDWSPDGKEIVFVHVLDQTNNALYAVTVATGAVRALTVPLPYLEHPVWSPSGSRLAFSYDADNNQYNDLVLLTPGGSPVLLHSCSLYYRQADCLMGSWESESGLLLYNEVTYVMNNGSPILHSSTLRKVSVDGGYDNGSFPYSFLDFAIDDMDLDSQRPTSQVSALPELVVANNLVLNIKAQDPGIAGLHQLVLEIATSPTGPWTKVFERYLNGVPSYITDVRLSASQYPSLPLQPGKRVYFRSWVTDKATNVEQLNGQPDAVTFLYAFTAAGTVTDQRDVPLPDVKVETPYLYKPAVTGKDGKVSLVMTNPGPLQVTFSKTGFNSPLAQNWSTAIGGAYAFHAVLPRGSTLLTNGNFEPVNGSALAGWQPGGSMTPVPSAGFSGQYAAALGKQCAQLQCLSEAENLADGWAYNNSASFIVDSQKTVHLVLYRTSYRARKADGTWTQLEPLPSDTQLISPLMVDSTDVLYFVAVRDTENLLMRRTPDGSWLNDPAPFTGSLLAARIDTGDNLHLVYNENAQLKYIRRESSGNWASPLTVGVVGSIDACGLAVGDGSKIFIGRMMDDGQLKLNILYPSGLMLPEEVREVAGPYGLFGTSQLLLEIDPLASLQVVASSLSTDSSYFLNRSAQGLWTEAQQLGMTYIYQGGKMDSAGNLHLIYSERNNNHKNIFYYVKPVGSTTIPSQSKVITSNLSHDQLQFTLDDAGRPHFLLAAYATAKTLSYQTVALAAPDNTSELRQTVSVPADMLSPTISFFYRLTGYKSSQPSSVELLVAPAGGQPELVLSKSEYGAWQHAWADLSAWKGQTITITLRLKQAAGQPYALAEVDEAWLSAWPVVSISSLSPLVTENILDWTTQTYTFTVQGENFAPDAKLYLGSRAIPFTYINSSELSFTLPHDLPPGRYSPRIVNPTGESDTADQIIPVGQSVTLPFVTR